MPRPLAGGSTTAWELHCRWSSALLARGDVDPAAGRLLAGSASLPRVGTHPAVSWAWGTVQAGDEDSVQVVFGHRLRRPVTASGHRIADRLWVAINLHATTVGAPDIRSRLLRG